MRDDQRGLMRRWGTGVKRLAVSIIHGLAYMNQRGAARQVSRYCMYIQVASTGLERCDIQTLACRNVAQVCVGRIHMFDVGVAYDYHAGTTLLLLQQLLHVTLIVLGWYVYSECYEAQRSFATQQQQSRQQVHIILIKQMELRDSTYHTLGT